MITLAQKSLGRFGPVEVFEAIVASDLHPMHARQRQIVVEFNPISSEPGMTFRQATAMAGAILEFIRMQKPDTDAAK